MLPGLSLSLLLVWSQPFPLLVEAFLVRLFQQLLDFGFLVQHLTLYQVIRQDSQRAVFLKGAPAGTQKFRQFHVTYEPFAVESALAGRFHFLQRLAGILQTAEKVGHARVLFVNEIVAHSFFEFAW